MICPNLRFSQSSNACYRAIDNQIFGDQDVIKAVTKWNGEISSFRSVIISRSLDFLGMTNKDMGTKSRFDKRKI